MIPPTSIILKQDLDTFYMLLSVAIKKGLYVNYVLRMGGGSSNVTSLHRMVGGRSDRVIRVLHRGGPANDWGVSLIAQGLSSPPI